MIKNLKISTKISVGFGLVIVFGIFLNLYFIYSLHQISENSVNMYEHPFTVSNAVKDVEINIIKIHREMKDISVATNIIDIEKSKRKVNEYETEVYQTFYLIDEWFLGEKKMVTEAYEAFKQWKPIRDEVILLTLQGKVSEANAITRGKGANHVKLITEKIKSLENFATNKADDFFVNTKQMSSKIITVSIISLLFITLFAISIAYFVTRSIKKGLKNVVSKMEDLAKGEGVLTSRININSKDELGELSKWFNVLIKKIHVTENNKLQTLAQNSEKLSLVGQLAAGMAHEIRNPLTPIKGFLQLMESGVHKEEYFEIMWSELNRVELIVSEFLVLAKPHVSSYSHENIQTLLESVITVINTQANLHNVQIIKDFDNDPIWITCDGNQIKQIFINITKNAIDAMPRGGEIVVEARQEDGYAIIRFIDQGIGIPEDKIRKIGEPFYTTKEKGTGLGMMISFQIVENHKGSIQINSKVNVGTTINILLPLSEKNSL